LKGEFSKVIASAAATNDAVEELKSMFRKYIGKDQGTAIASPFVSKSALEI
jgi:hypothetical protein